MSFWYRARQRLAQWIGLEIIHSQERYGKQLTELAKPGCRWLEIGCGRQILPDWAMAEREQRELAGRASMLVGIDFDAAILEHPYLDARVIASGYELPFPNGSFDLVTANMVVEHLAEPLTLYKEVERVLAPGGRFLFHTPNYRNYNIYLASKVPDGIKKRIIWLLERREEKDVFPVFYRSNTRRDIEMLASGAGLTVEQVSIHDSIGAFAELGPVGLLEVGVLKLFTMPGLRDLRSNIVTVLQKRTLSGRRG